MISFAPPCRTPVRQPLDSPILTVRGLNVDFPGDSRQVQVLNSVSFSLEAGEIHGIVGPSGCGKSVFARTIVRLEAPARITSGSIRLNGQELSCLDQRQMAEVRGKRLSRVLQNPLAAMDPVFIMGSQFKDVMSAAAGRHARDDTVTRTADHHTLSRIYHLLQKVGIASPAKRCRQSVSP